jgi:peptide/nickel transport system permease protein
MFSRVLHGARISMQVVIISLGVGMLVGVSLGIIAGYFGGIFDEVITRFVDIWNALPFLMVALVVVLIFGRSLTVLFFVLALIAWAGFVRVLRSQILILREMDYVASAKINGASHFRIMYRHLLPGVLNTAIVVATLNTSGLILSESVLSFVGAGIQPPIPAWGVMTNDGRNYLSVAPHQVLVPGGAIFLTVISLNFLGDWLRDRLDPRLRQVD